MIVKLCGVSEHDVTSLREVSTAWLKVSQQSRALAPTDTLSSRTLTDAPNAPSLQPASPQTNRVLFVDLLRVLAAFQMLQGHTISALLAPTYRVGALYHAWSVARGLTSVAFLFAAGLSFQLAVTRGASVADTAQRGRRKRVRRAAFLIGLGYALHLPFVTLLARDGNAFDDALRRWQNVDVLQCIGISLLALELSALFLPTAHTRAWVAAAVGVSLLALTPLCVRTTAGASAGWFEAFVDARVSLFPLLPWSAHVFFGAACGALVLPRAARPANTARRLLALALGLFGVTIALSAWSAHLDATWRVVVDHAFRLGCVVLICAGLAWFSRGVARLPAVLRVLAGETLFVYVFHVLLVYADHVGLAARYGGELAPIAAIVAALGIVTASFGAALLYQRIGNSRRAAT
jgi:hypothetical protein